MKQRSRSGSDREEPEWIPLSPWCTGPAFVAAVVLGSLAATAPVRADMAVTQVFAHPPLVPIWATVLGVLIESVIVWRFIGLALFRALIGVVVANAVSIPAGILIVALVARAGLVAGPEPSGPAALSAGVVDPGFLVLVGLVFFLVTKVLLPVFIKTIIELPILVLFGVRWRWRSFWILCLANLVSIALLFIHGWPPP